jgi:hypothetical protein
MSEIRKFRITIDSKECGTCSGSSPCSVAKKVVKKLCEGSKKIVKFSLKECKRDCKKVCGPYQGHMEKLDKPYKRNGKTITHRVVCEKVQIKKMRGGYNLYQAIDFTKKHIIPTARGFAERERSYSLPEFPTSFNRITIQKYDAKLKESVEKLKDDVIHTTFKFYENRIEWDNLKEYLLEHGNVGLPVNTYSVKGNTIIDFCKNVIILLLTMPMSHSTINN